MKEYRIEEYTEDKRQEWESFLETANNSTMFHSQRFFDYHPVGRFAYRHLMFYDDKKLVALLPGAMKNDGGVYVSSSGASYGGFVLPMESGIRHAHRIIDAFFDWAAQKGLRQFYLTPPPIYYARLPHDHIEFVLLKRGFEVEKSELTSIVHFQDRIEDNFALFKQTARTATRKAEKKGITVSFTDDYEGFYRILQSNLAMRHNVAPTHTLPELLKLKDLMPENIHQISAYKDGKMVAGVTVFVTNNKSLLAFYISHVPEFQKERPLNLLFYKLIEWGIDNGFKFLDFGTYTLNMEPNFGLARFKESFGARGLLRTTWKKTFA